MVKLTLSMAILIAATLSAQAAAWTGGASYYRAKGTMTCAHRFLPFGTRIRVTNLRNNHSAILVVNDRGPFIRGRIVDVSVPAADVLGFRRAGVTQVRLEVASD
ncbi:MAG: septal ring lytic transglycosylase RlpA family protein [Beijerinckiaceae bacterium]